MHKIPGTFADLPEAWDEVPNNMMEMLTLLARTPNGKNRLLPMNLRRALPVLLEGANVNGLGGRPCRPMTQPKKLLTSLVFFFKEVLPVVCEALNGRDTEITRLNKVVENMAKRSKELGHDQMERLITHYKVVLAFVACPRKALGRTKNDLYSPLCAHR